MRFAFANFLAGEKLPKELRCIESSSPRNASTSTRDAHHGGQAARYPEPKPAAVIGVGKRYGMSVSVRSLPSQAQLDEPRQQK